MIFITLFTTFLQMLPEPLPDIIITASRGDYSIQIIGEALLALGVKDKYRPLPGDYNEIKKILGEEKAREVLRAARTWAQFQREFYATVARNYSEMKDLPYEEVLKDLNDSFSILDFYKNLALDYDIKTREYEDFRNEYTSQLLLAAGIARKITRLSYTASTSDELQMLAGLMVQYANILLYPQFLFVELDSDLYNLFLVAWNIGKTALLRIRENLADRIDEAHYSGKIVAPFLPEFSSTREFVDFLILKVEEYVMKG